MKNSFKKKILLLFILVLDLSTSAPIKAQIPSPVHWKFSTVKMKPGSYELHLIATIDKPWHIYSQNNSVDGPVPTVVTVKPNPLAAADAKTDEKGRLVEKHEESFGMVVRYFEGRVELVKKIQVRGNVKTNVSGSVHFMACNDTKCLPATTVAFDVKLN